MLQWKRMAAAVLALSVALPCTPLQEAAPALVQTLTAQAAASSGTCGENLTWELNEWGKLVISGTGAMTDWKLGEYAPWYSESANIRSVEIKKGVTSIGMRAFIDCTGLLSITTPYSVTSIGKSAFDNCTLLELVNIYNPNCEIYDAKDTFCNQDGSGDAPFSGVIYGYPGSTAEAYAEKYGRTFQTFAVFKSGTCGENLTWEYFVPGLLIISGTGAMPDYGVYTPPDIPEDEVAPWETVREDIKQILIRDGVTSIGSYAFDQCNSLTDVILPESLTMIGKYAFRGAALPSVTLPDGITDIAYGVFNNCRYLSSVTLSENVVSIGNEAFNCCYALDSVTIMNPACEIYDSKYTFATDGVGNFSGTITGYTGSTAEAYAEKYERTFVALDTSNSGTCGENLTWTLDAAGTLTISGTGEMTNWSSAESVPWRSVRENIKKVIIENGVMNIGKRAFSYCFGLTSVTIPDSVTSIGEEAFSNCIGLTSVAIPDSVTSIGDFAFHNCTFLTSVTIPDSVVSIGSSAFRMTSLFDSTKLISINIGSGTTKIASNAFLGQNQLKSYTVSNDNPVYKSMDGVLFTKDGKNLLHYPPSKSDTDFTIPNGVTNIGSYAFYNCTTLISVHFPESVNEINSYAFYGCSFLTDVIMPNGITEIKSCAFNGCASLTDVTIPDSVTSIGEYAFYNCDKLTDVTILNPKCEIDDKKSSFSSNTDSNGAPFTGTIHGYTGSTAEAYAEKYGRTFAALDKPNSGTCGENLTWTLDAEGTLTISGTGEMTDWESADKVPWYAERRNIQKVIMDDQVTSIGRDAFCGCTSLTSITIPDNVTKIGSQAFLQCSALTSIIIPDSVTSIGNYTFYECSSLTSVTLSNNTTSVGNSTFRSCTSLRSVTVPESVASIDDYAFAACRVLNSISILNPKCAIYDVASTISNSNEDDQSVYTGTIHGYTGSTAEAYAEKYSRTFAALDTSATPVSKLSYTVTEDGVKILGLAEGAEVEYLVIPAEIDGQPVVSIGDSAFAGGKLRSVVIPEGVRSIGHYAFSGINRLKEIVIPDSVEIIGYQALEDTGWRKAQEDPLVIAGHVVIDGRDCTGSVAIPEGVRAIATYAFSGNAELTSVSLPASVGRIDYAAFMNCQSLSTVTIRNPECLIDDNSFTFCNSADPVGTNYTFTGTIIGYEQSTAQTYALDFDRAFWVLQQRALADLNGDTVVNASDAALILVAAAKIGAGDSSVLTPELIALADLNLDGNVNASDAALVLTYAAAAGAGFDGTVEEYLAGLRN